MYTLDNNLNPYRKNPNFSFSPLAWYDRTIINKIIDDLYGLVYPDIVSTRKEYRTKECLKVIILNYYFGYYWQRAFHYSRDKAEYKLDERYGQTWFRYSEVMSIMDSLYKLDYIEYILGYKDGPRTVTWARPKLIKLIHDIDIKELHMKSQPKELIMLKDDEKKLIKYSDSKITKTLRKNVRKINKAIKKEEWELIVSGLTKVEFIKNIINGLQYGSLTLISVNKKEEKKNKKILPQGSPTHPQLPLTSRNWNRSNDNYLNTLYNPNRKKGENEPFSTPENNLKNTSELIKILSEIIEKNNNLKELINLNNFGIKEIKFKIDYCFLHRIFNRGNKGFKFGGRFYGSFIQSVPSILRKIGLMVNGEKVIELDYSGLHLRMLYHMKGLNYIDDPYGKMCRTASERLLYKQIALRAINAKTETAARNSIRQWIIKEKKTDYKSNDEYLVPKFERFKEFHPEIKKWMNTDIGVELQYKDSVITEGILLEMLEKKIPCQPIHDSYIVPVQYKEELFKAMDKYYFKVMGFHPIIH